MELLTPNNWKDYQLIDSGSFEKLERFGDYVLSRPEPQAIWQKAMKESEWERIRHAHFALKKEITSNHDRGEWILKRNMPQQWWITYQNDFIKFTMRLGLTSFKHVGVFPEQAVHWDFITKTISFLFEKDIRVPKVLNLFAYTGGASLAAKAAGADVIHLDAVRPIITWAKDNMVASCLTDIRWVVEDALKFMRREAKRENLCHGIILDPPAYGRGPQGEKWLLEENLDELLSYCAKILMKKNSFFIINLYSMGFSAMVIENLIRYHFPHVEHYSMGELFLYDLTKRRLPVGTFLRFAIT